MMQNRQSKIHAIINPVSGVGSKRKIPRMIEAMAAAGQLSLKISFTERAGHAGELTRRAVEEGAEYILAVGGDGTVNEVAAAMIHSEAILGIIPKGSGNGLARELHIPMDARRAVEVIAKGNVRVIDACKANDRIFFTTCGVGFDAAVSHKFAGEKRRGSLAYVKHTIGEYLNYRPEVYELFIENRSIREKAFLVACANASQYGNNAYIAPHANIQDGKMDITILSPFTPLDIPSLAFQLFTKQIDKNSKIKVIQATQLRIHRRKQGMMHLDGEPVMSGKRIDLSVIPKALKVFTPETVSLTQEVRQFFNQVSDFFFISTKNFRSPSTGSSPRSQSPRDPSFPDSGGE
ncbi:MAG: diacylglycerol kinase family lipid kinase [Tannerellaceae bacterium]|jgi:YegS/Rv2252/BmrU family lipid kinase|nr:diacylglycerol kinase family lipid kinase [Tannerellaceae bacterium]